MGCKIPIKIIFTAVIGVILIIAGSGMLNYAHAGIVFVAHPSVTADTLSKSDIKKIFLGEKIVWENNTGIRLVVLKIPDIKEQFTKTYTGKTPIQFDRFWKKQVFTGQGSAPKSFDTEKDLIDFVAATEGAIGYVSASIKADDVKIITAAD